MKGNKGITLIALVITIIVLLILAGVSIAMLSGENSILRRANDARDNYAEGTLDESVKIAVGNIMTENLKWPGYTDATTIISETNKVNNKIEGLALDTTFGTNGIDEVTVTPANTETGAETVVHKVAQLKGKVGGKEQKVKVNLTTGAVTAVTE